MVFSAAHSTPCVGTPGLAMLFSILVVCFSTRAGGALASSCAASPAFTVKATADSTGWDPTLILSPRCAQPVASLPLRLRGGSARQQQQYASRPTLVEELRPEERKPELHRAPSVLVMDEVTVGSTAILHQLQRKRGAYQSLGFGVQDRT